MVNSAAADDSAGLRVDKNRIHQAIDQLDADQLVAFNRFFQQFCEGLGRPTGEGKEPPAYESPFGQTVQPVLGLENGFLKLIDEIPGMIWRSGPDGGRNYFNLSWLAFTGRELQQQIGGGWVDSVHPDDRERVLRTYRYAFENRGSFEMEFRLRHVSGEYCWVLDVGQPYQDERGEFSGFIGICYDITARKTMENALRDSEVMFKGLFENGPDAVVVVNSKGEIQLANQKALQMFAYSLDELQSMHVEMLMPGVYRERHRGHVADYVNSPTVREMGGRHLALFAQRKDGYLFPVDITLGPLQIETEMIVLATIRDVTHRKEIEEALIKSEARFHKIFSESGFGIVLIDSGGNIVEANPALAEMLKYPSEELIDKPHAAFIHPDDVKINYELIAKMIAEGQSRSVAELRYLAKDGSPVWIRFSGSLFRGEGRNPVLILGMIENNTAQKLVEAELAEVQRRLIDSSENERLLLSQELHDGPIQDLQALALHLAEAGLEENQEILSDLLQKMNVEVSQITQSLRSVCGDLRPPTLAPFGLEKAIRSHLQQTQEKYPQVQFTADLMQDRNLLSERVRLALFRIYQHAVTNSLRHSQAGHIDIQFGFDEQQIWLEVHDNGQGFSLPKRWVDLVRKGHFGLVGSIERAESVGGKLMVETQPGDGTTIRVTLPRSEADQIAARERISIH